MKSKNKTFMYLCLLVALFNIQPSFAKENSESTTTSEQTDIKSGDEIIITEIEPSENTQTTTVTVEEKSHKSLLAKNQMRVKVIKQKTNKDQVQQLIQGRLKLMKE